MLQNLYILCPYKKNVLTGEDVFSPLLVCYKVHIPN